MRILLIDPPYERLIGFKSEWFPFGLASIAAFLKKNGFDAVNVYHAEHSADTKYESVVKYSQNFHHYKKAVENHNHPVWKEVRQKIEKFKPDLIGITVMTPKVPSAQRISRICKEIDPKIKIVVGGHHPTIKAHEMLANKDIDFVIRGEGEETLLELLMQLKSGAANYRDIPGLSFRFNAEVVHNIDRGLIKNIDSLPLPARDRIMDLETYTPVQLSMIMTSRGCPYKCGFCATQNIWGSHVRFRSVENIIDEINILKKKYHVKNFTIMDDAFTINRGRVKELCLAIIENRLDITWSCLTRVDIISDEIIALMKKAGCTKVDIGIESGNQRVLDMIGKKIKLDQVRNAVSILNKNKMFWSGFFMFGFPTETEKEIRDTVNFMHELKPNWVSISIFTPYPGTALFDLSLRKAMITDPPDYSLYSHQNPNGRCTDTIPENKFGPLATGVLKEVQDYNSSYKSLIKRALTRNYHRNPGLLWQDGKKAWRWLKN
jgi:anaerobic magnesium-protoporphyrin IX monomethyl ester cyclase